MKCVVLGLDGASHSLIGEHLDVLPAFRRMKASGASGPLASTILPNSIPAWPVICTGKNPGRFGVFDFLRETSDHRFLANKAADVKAEFVWEMLTDNDIRCGLINVPCSSPFRSPIEFGEGDLWKKDWVNFTWADTTVGVNVTSVSLEKRIEELVDERFAQIDWVWENRDWEFLMMNLNSVDVMSHHRWEDREFIVSILRRIDRKLGVLLDSHPDLNLMVISDHGMVAVDKSFWTMNWLEDEGLLFRGDREEERKPVFTRRRAEKLINTVTWITEKLGIRKLAVRYGRNLGRKVLRKGDYAEDIGFTDFVPTLDWDRTIAYTHGHQGKIYLNSEHPAVSEDNEGVRRDIIERLRRFLEGNGMGVEIWRNEDIYTGPCSRDGEDLVFIVEDNRVLPQTSSLCDGQVPTTEKRPNFMQAHHHRTGIFFASGPDIRNTTLDGASLYDITPTVLRLFGFEVPQDIDGKSLDIFASERESKPLGRREELLQEIDF